MRLDDGERSPGSVDRQEKLLALFILAVGVALRILFCATNDPRNTYDDHFHVIRVIHEEHRLPRADEGWQTYQPPLYHLSGAGVYGVCRTVGGVLELSRDRQHAIGRKAIQWISAVCGVATLLLVWRILRDLGGIGGFGRLAGLSVAAVLPGHIYMCGMATNDAMVYLWITLSLWGVIRCTQGEESRRHSGAYRWPVIAGVSAGLAMLTKHSGLVALVPMMIFAVGPWIWKSANVFQKKGAGRNTALMVSSALLVGCFPYVRDTLRYGTPIPSNYTLVEHTMHAQPPGRWQDVSFLSFRMHQLMARPWLHLDQVDSFWTQTYAGLWFDHSSAVSLWRYIPWKKRFLRIWGAQRPSEEDGLREQLSWGPDDVPTLEAWQGRMLYVLGLLPTALVLIGFCAAFSAGRRSPGWALVLGCLAINWLVPVFQSLRQPHYSSMKAAFALGSLPAMAAMVALAVGYIDRRGFGWGRWLIGGWTIALAAVVCWHFVYLGLFAPMSGEPFDPL